MKPSAPQSAPSISWQEEGREHCAQWRSEAALAPPARMVVADDRITADQAWRLVCEGTALLWRGDFQNARQLLQAMQRRADKPTRKNKKGSTPPRPANMAEAFHQHRMAQALRSRLLGRLLIPLDAHYGIPLRRAPSVVEACTQVWGAAQKTERESESTENTEHGDSAAADRDIAATSMIASVVSLRELQGLLGAHEWRKKGVPIATLGGATIHPHYGVFSPVRGEYLDLVATAPLPFAPADMPASLAFDVGTGSGVIAAVLAQRGLSHITATDSDPRALACAQDNLRRLGMADRVDVINADLFPPGRAPLIVCNPPWLPGKVTSPIEGAIYDPDSRMLKGFLSGLKAHLLPGGEGWLILSDFAELLGLRARGQLLQWIEAAGLQVIDRHETRPRHPKAMDRSDPLYLARVAETTTLWRLAAP